LRVQVVVRAADTGEVAVVEGLGGSARRSSRVERATGGALEAFSRVSAPAAWGGVVLGLVLSWLIAYLVGGAGVAAPHWFYLPVLYAAARFGCWGAAVSAVAAGLLAGPAMPLDVAAGVAQQPEDWITRATFFVIIGQAMAVVIGLSRSAMAAEFERLHMEKELRSGIHRREFVLHYQPIVSLSSGEIVGVEALVRWQHPEWGLLFPDRFIAEAETSGLIVGLGEQVLDMACRQLVTWQSGPLRQREFFKLAVNVSARQLAEPGLVAHVDDRIRLLGIEPSWLHLEVTETALVTDVDASSARLAELKTLGVALAIDDFGTGRASLSYLHQFPVDVVKIDRSFVASLGSGGRADEVSRAVIQLATDLHMRTVAEGVEALDQIRLLRDLGCDLAQGYYFSRPLPPDELLPLLGATAPFASAVITDRTRLALVS
jgi:EAL domain-containing protein (putative c-di-GMP-specific phosphodiesterase class I)